MKIRTIEQQIVETVLEEFEIPIPEETIYLFETGIRRSIRIIPQKTTWNINQYDKPEECYKLDITCVYLFYETKIEKFEIPISSIERIFNSKEKSKEKSIIDLLVNDWGDERTKERFDADLKEAIDTFIK